MSAVAGLVLAAGRGRRFGASPKLLARLGGEVLVRRVALAAIAAGLDPVMVVLGHEAEALGAVLDGLPVHPVLNPSYADGLSTSLRAGLAALPAAVEAVVVLLGDMPCVQAGTVRALTAAFAAGRPAAVVPTYRGQRGNPVLLSAELFTDLRALSGDTGAGPLLRGRAGALELPTDDPAILADIDTPAALARLEGGA